MMAIKTREFSTETGNKYSIDMAINMYLSSGYVEELIDIKYQTTAIDVGDLTIIRTSALMIYKRRLAMDRHKAVKKLARQALISTAHAEDLYDSFFEKPVVPQYVADWYEGNKLNLDLNLCSLVFDLAMDSTDSYQEEFIEWANDNKKTFITTLVNMHQFGYEVEEEKRYTVRLKGVDGYATHLNQNLDNQEWFFASNDDIKGYRTKHTRKELEANGFGWVFNCPGVEVKEVE